MNARTDTAIETSACHNGPKRNSQICPPGFTLLELLVVISVLALLAALLLPGLSRAKSAAQFAACKSNLRQMVIALRMYANDTGVYPGWWFGNYPNWDAHAPGNIVGWHLIIQDLLCRPVAPVPGRDNKPVLTCPSFARLLSTNGLSYAYNCGGVATLFGSDRTRRDQFGLAGEMVSFPVRTAADVRPVRESQVLRPSQMIALGDTAGLLDVRPTSEWNPTGNGGPYDPNPIWAGMPDLSFGTGAGHSIYNGDSADYPILSRRHNFKWNIAFCDGHVEGFKPPQLFDMSNPEVRRIWNNDNQPHPEFSPGGL